MRFMEGVEKNNAIKQDVHNLKVATKSNKLWSATGFPPRFRKPHPLRPAREGLKIKLRADCSDDDGIDTLDYANIYDDGSYMVVMVFARAGK